MMNLFVRSGRRTRAMVLAAGLVLSAMPAWGAIFGDIQGNFAQRAIERIAAKGVMRGSSDKFNPNGAVNRAELAVSLTRALGLSGQDLPVPDVKDWNDVPKEAQSAVIVLTGMGTVSPQKAGGTGKVELRKGDVLYTLSSDKAVYAPTEMVLITFTIANVGKSDVIFEYVTAQTYDFIVKDSRGNEVARWSLGRAFLPNAVPISLKPGVPPLTYVTRWRQLDQNDDPVPPGRYEIIAVNTTKTDPASVSLIFNRGMMQLFPDRTFRPKQEVTRAEAAALAARLLGLAEESSAGLQGITDAAEIPAPDRGAVAAAVEKKLILVGADRSLRPSRSATRADVAWMLDVLMDTQKRYDFSKGILKDIRVGNPTLIQIEDDRKALRTFRVARAHAVYRNNGAAELKELKVGDTLLFLKAGDAGDVAYIEATGR